MGLTISEEQEREDRSKASMSWNGPVSIDLGARLRRAWSEIDALRERVKTLEGALRHYAQREYHSTHDSDGQIQFVADEALAPLKEADRG